MSNDGIVNIHGKDYMTVAKRVELAHTDKAIEEWDTHVIPTTGNHVVIKATIRIKGVSYTGISSVDLSSSKMIEKSNPYEVAETSAVGRALGFAGYGIVEGIASADEMVKGGQAQTTNQNHPEVQDDEPPMPEDENTKVCSAHGEPAVMQKGFSKSKFNEDGTPKSYWFHKVGTQMCFGDGFKS